MDDLEALELTGEQRAAVESALDQLRRRAEQAEQEAGRLRSELDRRNGVRFAAPIGAGGPPLRGSGRAARLAEEYGRTLFGR